jgi:sugar diacid utilization regulator
VNTSLAKSTLRELHWNSEDNYLAVVFTSFSPDGMKDVHTMICNQLDLLFLESCTVILDHVAVMVMNTTKNNDYKEGSLHQKLSIFLRENTFKAGISNPVPDFFHLQTAYLEASAALEIGNRKNSTFWYYYFSDYVLDYIINKSSQEIPRNYLSHPAIQKLQEHDLQCGTEYYITLKAYFECQYNSTHAAETLYIHRTTFISRLEKIIAITKLDLNDWNTRLHLMISFTL